MLNFIRVARQDTEELMVEKLVWKGDTQHSDLQFFRHVVGEIGSSKPCEDQSP